MIEQRGPRVIAACAFCAVSAVIVSGCDFEDERLSPSEAYQQSLEMAEEGDRDSIFDLAYAYSRGLGTDQDIDKALEYLKSAAEEGHGRAQLMLSEAYLQINRGRDLEEMIQIRDDWYEAVEQDLESGYKWLLKAELNDDTSVSRPAEGILVAMIQEMSDSERQKFFEVASEYGHPEWQDVAKKMISE
ncbi:hypothetical protein HH1059_16320 [Halorhodospira halochloris]|uniref:Sel1 repeat family protein n=1 Tax=Halorhodospira halochloris TaxID=1052 RepID=A0A0X8XA77_HALHR|nr:SEL1-like repeat protein [Halorhodospira halochloris]MBK1652235.1 hypothetical protein [Halorhodospira halochloris]MCG5547755.1 SEL1-like repeat protein [Halorhodospira halochloris]BAU58342.1 hypothetical protein HH1059_16320 [Halorhodospira halochloris]